jgi:phosphoesterase RecJ-like protein
VDVAHFVPRESVVPLELLEFIKTGEKFLIAGHKEPDGDCVGSQLVLASVLHRIGKEAILYSSGPFNRTEIKPYEHLFVSVLNNKNDVRVILVDCSSVNRTGELALSLEGLPKAVIDHHDVENYTVPGGLVYVDKAAPSTTFLVLKLIDALNLEPTQEEAELLFFGLCTDTGFFRHVDIGGAETFEAAAALIRWGANPKAAFAAINGGKSLDSRRFIGYMLTRAESLFDGKLLLSFEEYDDIRHFGLESRDSDSLYQLLQSVIGCEAIVIIRQETPEKCSVGFRSRNWVDVGSIAASFGGGGHKNAAATETTGTIPELRLKIIDAFAKIF